MYLVGGFLLVLGIGFLVVTAMKRAAMGVWLLLFGLDFSLTGLAVIIFKAGSAYFPSDYAGRALAIGMGLLCYSAFAMNTWLAIVCREKVMAEYTGFRTIHNHQGPNTYAPVFSYEWEGQNYHDVQSQRDYSKRKIKNYQQGNRYCIYVNPRQPQAVMAARRLSVGDALLFCCGSIFVIMACM